MPRTRGCARRARNDQIPASRHTVGAAYATAARMANPATHRAAAERHRQSEDRPPRAANRRSRRRAPEPPAGSAGGGGGPSPTGRATLGIVRLVAPHVRLAECRCAGIPPRRVVPMPERVMIDDFEIRHHCASLPDGIGSLCPCPSAPKPQRRWSRCDVRPASACNSSGSLNRQGRRGMVWRHEAEAPLVMQAMEACRDATKRAVRPTPSRRTAKHARTRGLR